MAAGSSGQNTVVNIPIQASTAGIKESIDALKRLGDQLSAIDKQLRSGLNTDVLGRQFASVVREFDKLSRSVTSGSSSSEKAIDSLANKVKALNAEVRKGQEARGIGFIGDKSDKEAVKKYQERMEAIGTPVMGGAKSMQMLVRNQRNLAESLKSTTTAGIATQASIRAVHDAGSIAFMPALTRGEKFKIQLASLRKDIASVTQSLQSAAKDQQWIGRQMIEGITVPVVGFGTMAVRSFMAVQSEMIQLKKVTEFGAATNDANAFYDSLVNGADGIRKMSREFGVSRKSATALFKDVAALGVDGEDDIKAFAKAVSEVALVGDVDTSTAMQFFRTMNAIFAEGKTNAEGLANTRDLMAQMSAVADETSLQLQDLAQAFPEVAPVMAQMGFSAAGVAASLAGMYKRGIPATEAAHGLKFALQRLVSPTKDSQELIDKMGFSFFDASGNIKKADVEIMAMAKNLEEGMSAEAASKALGELFGLRQSARMKSFFQDVNIGRKELERFSAGTLDAANLTSDYARGLVAAGFGVKGATGPLERYNKALEEIKKDPTIGLKKLKSAFDDFKVQLGATVAPALLAVGEKLTSLLDAFTNLPSGIQIAIIGAAGFLAVLGPLAYMSAQATHAMASMGRMASAVLPKMVDITEGMARSMAALGRRDVAQIGSRFVGLQKFADRFRVKLGIPTAAEKAVKAAGGAGAASSMAPETTATGALTSAKNALETASARVAAAEAVESASHNANTAAMNAQTIATQRAAQQNADAFKTPLQKVQEARKKMEDEKKRILKSGGYEATGARAGAQYRKNGKFVAKQEVDAYLEEHLSRSRAAEKVRANAAKNQADLRRYNELRAEKARARAMTATMTSQYNDIIRSAQNQPTIPLMTRMGFGSKAGGVGAQFASLYSFADKSFFKPVGKAADFAKGKIIAMAKAAKMSAVGQGVISAGSATFGAFGKGKSGALSGAAGAAAMSNLGGVGKIFGKLGQVFGIFTGKLNLMGGPLGNVISLFLKFNKVTLILTVVAGLIAFVVMMFKGMKTNWEAVMAKIQPGIDAIKAAFDRLKETFAGVFDKMMNIFGQLGSGAKEGESAASAFEGVGEIISQTFNAVAIIIDFVGSTIEFLWPVFERTAYIIKDVVGLISALFKGQWADAFMYALGIVYEWARPVIMAFDVVAKAIAQALSTIIGLLRSAIDWIPIVPQSWKDGLKDAQDAVEGFSDRGFTPFLDETFRSGLGGIFGPGNTGPAKIKAQDAGKDLGETLGDAINGGAGDAADGESWVKEWISKVVEQIDKQLEKLRKSATDALEKAQEAALKVYDDRIKAIEDQEKAEEKLYKTEEYLSNKRELLARRSIDIQNYLKNKALAVYEGRYDDARMLDLKEKSDKTSYNKDLTNLEQDRSRDLLKDSRELAKDQINIEKDAAKERLDIQKQAFEDYLDELYKMTPVTVDQFQSMMDQINGVLQANGATWPEYATGAMKRMGDALRDANKAVINEFNRSENNPLLQWVAAFAEPEVVRILKAGLAKAGGGSSGAGAGAQAPAIPPGGGISVSDAQGFLLGYKQPEGWDKMTPEKKSEYIKSAEAAAGVPEAERGKTMPGSEHYKKMEAEYQKVLISEKESNSIKERSIALYGKEQGLKSNNLVMAKKIADAWTNASTIMKNNNIDFTRSSVDSFKNVGNMGTREAKKINEVWDQATNTLSYLTDEFGNKWTVTQNGMVNQFGETANAIKDESGKITQIQIQNANSVMRASTVSYQLAQGVFQEMISKGIKPGTEEASKYEQRIKGLGYQASVVNGQQVLIPVSVDDDSAKATLGRLYRLISETNNQLADDPDTSPFRRIFARIKATAFGNAAAALGYAEGGLVKAKKDGVIAQIGEGGFDEYVITTDPKYRASNLGYLAAAASKLGVKMASGAAIKAAAGGMFTSAGAASESVEYASGMGGDVYISVDTFIGEEQWFAEMANKYNMKTVPRQRKIEGQQKRVVSSYNDRYRLR